MPAAKHRLAAYFLVFASSGFSGLIYESIWTHYLKLFLGHAAYAQSLVLGIFMGGMALGSWICGRYSGGWRRLLLGYAAAEAAIGLLALAFHGVFDRAVSFSYTTAIPMLGGPASVVAYKWLLSTLLILPASILLGMTFPLMTAGIIRAFPERPGRTIGMLYFTNSLGAAIGVLASGFLLIQAFGLPGTIRLAGLLNLALALLVALMARTEPGQAPVLRQAGGGARRPGGPLWGMMLAVALVTGASSFMYEIGWIRMLALVLGTTTHAFELMLSAFILGLALGGLFVQRRIDGIGDPLRYLGVVQVLMGLLALTTLPLYDSTFDLMRWIVRATPRTDAGYAAFVLSSNGIALGIMVPTTFFAGMTLPLITGILMRAGHGEKSIGAVYAANTIGAIAGVVVAVHVGLPVLGLKGLLVLGGALDAALGVILIWRAAGDGAGRRLRLAAAGAAIAAVALTAFLVRLDPYKMASGVYRKGELLSPGAYELAFHRDGKTSTVSVLRDILGTLSIRTNGKSDSAIAMRPEVEPTADEFTTTLMAVLPLLHQPEARSAAVIGLGTGMTSSALLAFPGLERVDTIEIEREIVNGARSFRPRAELAFTDARGRTHIDDAKTFFSTQRRKYDLVVSEPSNPWVSGVAGLFSQEFYRLVRTRLEDGGILVQWIQTYEISPPLVASIFKALGTEFRDFAVYAANDMDMIVVATSGARLPALDPKLLASPGWSAELGRLGIAGVQDVAIRKIATRETMWRWVEAEPIPPNSDYFPVLDQGAGRARFLGSTAPELMRTARGGLPVFEMLAGERHEAPTRVTPSREYADSRAAAYATGLRDFFQSGALEGTRLPPAYATQALRLHELLLRPDASDAEERVGLLFNVAVSMTPYLTSSEMAAFWRVVEASPSARATPPAERRWRDLLKAVGERDGAAMLRLASRFLEEDPAMPEAAARYVLSAGMLGATANGAREQATGLWSRFGGRVGRSPQADFLFGLLGAPPAAPAVP